MVECSKAVKYTTAAVQCVNISGFTFSPLGAPLEEVVDFHTSFLQPIYLNQNTSQLMGFMVAASTGSTY